MIARVVEVVREAGRIIRAVQDRGAGPLEEGPRGPVTEADRAADRYLRARLRALAPAGWLSEESADDPSRLQAGRVWVVDPLDGTKEFLQGLPEYAISVALVEGDEAVLAVVHNPATGETWTAVRGEGASREGNPLAVDDSEGPEVGGRSTLLASRTELATDEFVPFQDEWALVPRGSIAYKLALVAEGRGAATLSRGPKGEWDICAGALLVEEAGGVATDVFGDPLVFNQPFPRVRGILAGAPEAHRRLLGQVQGLPVLDRMRDAREGEDPELTQG